jgi:hypothetical protein
LKGSDHRVITFADSQAQGRFFRHMRLLGDDINELSSTVGIFVALSQRANDQPLLLALNRNPVFWNSMLASLSTTAFIVMGRIHDKDKNAYLNAILKVLRSRNYLSDVLSKFETIKKTHDGLITKVLAARHNIFGHSNFHRRLYVVSGIPGTWEDFATYWRSLSEATKDIEERMFPSEVNYGPKLNLNLLNEDIAEANKFFDQLLTFGSS